MSDTAALPQAVLDDDYVCAYGVCTSRDTYRITPHDRPYAGVCVEHLERVNADHATTRLPLDGRRR